MHGPGDECHNTTRVGAPATSLLFRGDIWKRTTEAISDAVLSGIIHMAVPQGMGMGMDIDVVQVITVPYIGSNNY